MGYELVGNNLRAYEDHTSSEVLLAGPAGSGKTYSNILKMLRFANDHHGSRMLMVRKTRKSLAESSMVTLERMLQAVGMLGKPIERTHRHSYKLPGGSVIIVGGMDDPSKVLSTEYNLIYANECTQLSLNDWEELSFRLRAPGGGYFQMLGDCNPESKHHWLYKRFIAGRQERDWQPGKPSHYKTTHLENPGYYNWQTRRWTEAGEVYMRRLQASSGIRYERKYLGDWCNAEGAVYAYDPSLHTWTGEIPWHWPRVWGIDWGKRVPTALGIWAVDPEGRMYFTREVYKTHYRADLLGKRAKKWIEDGKEPRPRAIICDVDTEEEGYRRMFEAASGLTLTLADKAERMKGIQDTQARFDIDPDDNRPRIYFRPNTMDHEPDRGLVDSGLPTNMIEELSGYVWDEDQLEDAPIEDKDHHMDEMRYSARHIDKLFPRHRDPIKPVEQTRGQQLRAFR